MSPCSFSFCSDLCYTMLAQQPVKEVCIRWSPNCSVPRIAQSPPGAASSGCAAEIEVFPTLDQGGRGSVVSKYTDLFALVLSKLLSTAISYSLSITPLSRDFSWFLHSCSSIVVAPLQTGSFSVLCSGFLPQTAALASLPKEKRACSPSLLVSFSISKAHPPTLGRFDRLILLLHSCQAKTRVITQRLSYMHTPFFPFLHKYFKLLLDFNT